MVVTIKCVMVSHWWTPSPYTGVRSHRPRQHDVIQACVMHQTEGKWREDRG